VSVAGRRFENREQGLGWAWSAGCRLERVGWRVESVKVVGSRVWGGRGVWVVGRRLEVVVKGANQNDNRYHGCHQRRYVTWGARARSVRGERAPEDSGSSLLAVSLLAAPLSYDSPSASLRLS
jgi:hypothetical protein